MDIHTLIALMEEAIAQGKVQDVPAFLGELERLKAILWSRMVSASCSSTSNRLPDAGTLLTMPQVAKRLAIPEGRAYELARQGRLPTVRVGKYVRVSPAELEAWVGQQTSLERRIDEEPPDLHSALPRRKRSTRVLTGVRAYPGTARGKRYDRGSSKPQPRTQVGIRPQDTTSFPSVEAGSVEAESSQDEG